MDFVIYILSIWALVGGANFVIINSGLLLMKFNAPKFIFIAILVSFGSSLPEITNSIVANMNNRPIISIANLIGSNIFNIAVILPLITIFSKPSILKSRDYIEDVSWIFLTTIIFLLVSLDGKIGFFESIFLIFCAVLYIFTILDRNLFYEDISHIENIIDILKSIFLVLLGITFILSGAYFTFESAISIANSFDISDWILGLLFIAFSTSFPKLIILLSILFKKKPKVAISIILSSTIFNITLGVGLSGIIKDIFIFESNIFDILMLPFLALMILVCISNRVYTKPIAFIFFGVYLIFLLKHLT